MNLLRSLVCTAALTLLSGCATIAGGMIGTGVGLATGRPISGALIGTGVGIMIDTAPSQDRAPSTTASNATSGR